VVSARALYHCEALCKKEDVQRFLTSLVNKRPEVGHLVKCFHTSKSTDTKATTTTTTVHKHSSVSKEAVFAATVVCKLFLYTSS
jgi:hypothetical protein